MTSPELDSTEISDCELIPHQDRNCCESDALAPTESSRGLSSEELMELGEAEERISRGIRSFLEVGRALAAIKERRLYRATHSSFSAYLKERWGFNRAHGYRLVNSVHLLDEIRPHAASRGVPLPENERQLRLLRRVKDPKRCCDVLARAQELAGKDGIQYRHYVQAFHDLGLPVGSEGTANAAKMVDLSDSGALDILALLTERFEERGDCQLEIQLLERLGKIVNPEGDAGNGEWRTATIEFFGAHQKYVIQCRRNSPSA